MKTYFLLAIWGLFLMPFFEPNAKITGHIYDEKKELIPFATIMLYENGKLLNATYSDEKGAYNFTSLEVGTYQIKASNIGFSSETISDIAVKEKENKVVDVYLKITKSSLKNATYATSISTDDKEEEADGDGVPDVFDAEDEPAGGGDLGISGAIASDESPKLSPPPPPPAPMMADVRIMEKKEVASSVVVSEYKSTRSKGTESPTKHLAKPVAAEASTYKWDESAKKEKKADVEKKIVRKPKEKIDIPIKEPEEEDAQAGKLTAGEVNDFSKWKMWNGIAKDEFKAFQNEWKMIPEERYMVQVENAQHHPMPNLKVELRNNEDVIWTGRTDNTGKAELWANFFQQIAQSKGRPTKIVVYDGEKTTELSKIKPFTKGINLITIQKNCEKNLQVDIAFVVDATGSMGDEIAHIRADLKSISGTLADTLKNWTVNFGSVFYKDYEDDYLTRTSPFSTDVKQAQDFMYNTNYGGGGDFPEAVESGLEEAIQKLKWNENASTRILFLVLDAPAHTDEETLIKLQMQIRSAAHKGIRIIPVACSGIDKSTEYLLRSMALATNGTYSFLTDDSGIGSPHIKPSTDKFKVEKFYELAVRLVCQYTYQPDCKPVFVDKPQTETVFQSKVIDKDPKKAQKDGDTILGKDSVNNKVWVEQKTVSWKYYPNPTKGKLTIEVGENVGEIFLSDISGKVLERYDAAIDKKFEIDLSAYANGIYFLRYEYETDKWLNGKVILER